MKEKRIPVLIAAVLLLLITAAVAWEVAKRYIPSKEPADLNQVLGVEGEETAIFFNEELQKVKGITRDDQTYLPIDWVNDNLNEKFYWDNVEKLLVYTLPDTIVYADKRTMGSTGLPLLLVDADKVYLSVGLINNYLGHILPQLALPVGVFLLKQFMEQVPDSLSEAARLDGASEFTVFWKIVMPAVLPAVGTVMIISFQNVWNDVTTSQYYMLDDSMKTLPYYIQTLTSSTGTTVARQGASAAAGLLLFLPNFIIFAVMQKSMLKTMVTSGIK